MEMTELEITCLTATPSKEEIWISELRSLFLSEYRTIFSAFSKTRNIGHLVLIDEKIENLEEVLKSIESSKRVIIIVADEQVRSIKVSANLFHRVLVYPFRYLEFADVIQSAQKLISLAALSDLDTSMSHVVEKLKEDVELATRLQKQMLPEKYSNIKGIQVSTRYLAGMKSGGDYFDLGESKDGKTFSFFLSDSSSYGLSSAVLTALMRVALALSTDDSRSPLETLQKVFNEILKTLKPKDRWSVLYGVYLKDQQKLLFTSFGSVGLFVQAVGKTWESAMQEFQPALSAEHGSELLLNGKIQTLQLRASDRLLICSDGILELWDNTPNLNQATSFLNNLHKMEYVEDLLNEIQFEVKKRNDPELQMPAQDCTSVLVEIGSNVISLSRVKS